MDQLAQQIADIRARIAAAAQRAGRSPSDIRLVGVSKTHPAERVAEAAAAGLADFGENRIQEAEPKIGALAAAGLRPTWHLIGHLQTNKARRAAQLFDYVHSVDSLRVAEALSRAAGERSAPLQILLQVNVSGEQTKEGYDLAGWPDRPALLEALCADVAQIGALPGLAIAGLMTIAPWGSDPQAARPHFRSTRELRDELARRFPQLSWGQLSMGMTDDFEVAIEEGATIVRVGRAIFGARV